MALVLYRFTHGINACVIADRFLNIGTLIVRIYVNIVNVNVLVSYRKLVYIYIYILHREQIQDHKGI